MAQADLVITSYGVVESEGSVAEEAGHSERKDGGMGMAAPVSGPPSHPQLSCIRA
jgi:hypothetical protein